MTTEVRDNTNRIFIDSETSQDVESGKESVKSTEGTDSDESDNKAENEMPSNQEDNPSTIITTNIIKHPISLITVSTSDDAVYEYIHWDYFVDKKTQLDNKFWRNKDTKNGILFKKKGGKCN